MKACVVPFLILYFGFAVCDDRVNSNSANSKPAIMCYYNMLLAQNGKFKVSRQNTSYIDITRPLWVLQRLTRLNPLDCYFTQYHFIIRLDLDYFQHRIVCNRFHTKFYSRRVCCARPGQRASKSVRKLLEAGSAQSDVTYWRQLLR